MPLATMGKRKKKQACSHNSSPQDHGEVHEEPARETGAEEIPLPTWKSLPPSGLLPGKAPSGLPAQSLREFCSDFQQEVWGRQM